MKILIMIRMNVIRIRISCFMIKAIKTLLIKIYRVNQPSILKKMQYFLKIEILDLNICFKFLYISLVS